MFKIKASRSILKDITKLPGKIRERVSEILEKMKFYPIPVDEDVKKLSGVKDVYRIRIGKYRIIFKVFWKERTIKILFIGTREHAYEILKKRS